ncbi:uncharacterized protein LOC129773228 [Toxorhynchites rutilus septentrionalis]|uniref:uncharacterized protein LOC129773228 n=1 Tax=Toxorhynchites rutilus septentrionalis TaxID=329112 RepID=UPI002478E4A6|nr:uncharacterized protein LOC129773228 [Toxorhynchites rutilus septentrionalis]
MLFSSDYSVYRGDRTALTSTKKRSGGVLIAVKDTIPSSLIPTNVDSIEHVWVSLSMSQCKLVIGAVYIPPDKASDVQLSNLHIDCMESVVLHSGHDSVAVFGDYNRPGLRWIRNDNSRCCVDLTISSITQSNSVLLDGMSSNNMWQMNCLKNHSGNTLDLLFVNEEITNYLTIDEIDNPLVPTDIHHPPFSCTIEIDKPILELNDHEFDVEALNFKKADFNRLGQYLSSVDWSPMIQCVNLDDAVEKFTLILQRAFILFVPHLRPPQKPPWSNAELRRRNKRCNAAHKIYRRNRTSTNKASFQFASRQYRSLNRQLYRKHVVFMERNLKRNPKSFWNFVKSKRKESTLPSAMYLDERLACSSSDKCELFASSSMFNPTSDSVEAALELTPAGSADADTPEVSSEGIRKAVEKLKISYQPGPDGIAACVLKKCFEHLEQPLTHLYNLSLRTATFPTRSKASFMFPVHKKRKQKRCPVLSGHHIAECLLKAI